MPGEHKMNGSRLLCGVATLWAVGRTPIAPGTAASLITALVLWALKLPLAALLAAFAAVTVLGVIASESAERSLGRKDPSEVVIDEVAGMILATVGIPHGIYYFGAAFLLFRFFDIVKPPPINMLQKLRGGWGIMVDDILAGLAANAILQAWIIWG
jgi:phosphatidylglycerophosphatase A